MSNHSINYSQCWEDPDVLLEALNINQSDVILSITSGGDNSLALLAALPRSVVSLDLNIAQNYLLELKIVAARCLTYHEYVEFLGGVPSKRRKVLYKKISPHLSSEACEWWSAHELYIEQGPINCGRFERFTALFAKRILPLIHSRKTVEKLLSCDEAKQQKVFFETHWNTKKWRFFLGLFTNKFILKRFARQGGMFSHAHIQNVAAVYKDRMEQHLSSISTKGNFFIHYSLTGEYGDSLPPYLEKDGYIKLRDADSSSLSIQTGNLIEYLKSTPDNTFSKFNLSDVFEALSETENKTLWGEIIRTAKPHARVAYWNNLVARSYPKEFAASVSTNSDLVQRLQMKDRVFFYDSFHVHEIIK